MNMSVFLLSAALLTPAAALEQPRSDQKRAFEARREGRILPVREIERRVLPSMPGASYIGFDFDHGPAVYTLKFLREGNVIWVEVDGRTGQVIGRSGR
jgi:uncharacterized membrane protein YkoI